MCRRLLLALLFILPVAVASAQPDDPLARSIPEDEGVSSAGISRFLFEAGHSKNEFHGFMAKVGELYLQKGNWKGRQLLPKKWVEEAVTSRNDEGPAGCLPVGVRPRRVANRADGPPGTWYSYRIPDTGKAHLPGGRQLSLERRSHTRTDH